MFFGTTADVRSWGAERTSPQNASIGEVPGKGFALMPADEATASGITGAATAQQRLEK